MGTSDSKNKLKMFRLGLQQDFIEGKIVLRPWRFGFFFLYQKEWRAEEKQKNDFKKFKRQVRVETFRETWTELLLNTKKCITLIKITFFSLCG